MCSWTVLECRCDCSRPHGFAAQNPSHWTRWEKRRPCSRLWDIGCTQNMTASRKLQKQNPWGRECFKSSLSLWCPASQLLSSVNYPGKVMTPNVPLCHSTRRCGPDTPMVEGRSFKTRGERGSWPECRGKDEEREEHVGTYQFLSTYQPNWAKYNLPIPCTVTVGLYVCIGACVHVCIWCKAS